MGRPIKKEYFDGEKVLIFSIAKFSDGKLYQNCEILKQISSRKYRVSNGTVIEDIVLDAGTDDLLPGYGIIIVYIKDQVGKRIFLTEDVSIKNPGTGYKVNDVVNVENYGTVKITEIANFNLKGSVVRVSPDETHGYATTKINETFYPTGGSGKDLSISLDGYSSDVYSIKEFSISSSGSGYSIGDILTASGVASFTVTSISDTPVLTILPDFEYFVDDISGTYTLNSNESKGSGMTVSITTNKVDGYICDDIIIKNSGQDYLLNDIINTPIGSYSIIDVSQGNKQGEVKQITTDIIVYSKNDISSDSVPVNGGYGTGLTLSITTSQSTSGVTYPGHIYKICQNLISTGDSLTFKWNLDNSFPYADTGTMTASLPYKSK